MRNVAEMLVALNEIQRCPNPSCGDTGATVIHKETGVWQEQCEFCYANPKSKYQFKQDLIQLFEALADEREVERLQKERNDLAIQGADLHDKLNVAQEALFVIARGGHTDGHAGNMWITGCTGCIARDAYNKIVVAAPVSVGR